MGLYHAKTEIHHVLTRHWRPANASVVFYFSSSGTAKNSKLRKRLMYLLLDVSRPLSPQLHPPTPIPHPHSWQPARLIHLTPWEKNGAPLANGGGRKIEQ